MTTATIHSTRAFAVLWKDIDRWVIPSNLLMRYKLPSGWRRMRIGEIVRQVSDRIRPEKGQQYKMAGVKLYGKGVFHRETVWGEDLSASQISPLVVNALIYNRLFAWKATFAVVSPEHADCFVSGEFPQFIPDPKFILPEYLYLFCTRDATIRAVNAASIGSSAVSRNRFREEEFLAFEIPLPPLLDQKRVVDRWHTALKDIENREKWITERRSAILARMFLDLGLRAPAETSVTKAFAVRSPDLLRWGVRFNFLNQSSADLSKGKYPVVELGTLLQLIQYGTSEKASSNGPGVSVIRIGNVKDGELDLSRLKYVSLPKKSLDGLLLNHGDILLIRTSGSRDLVGTSAVFHSEGEFVFASYLIRLVINDKLAIPEFVSWFLNSPSGRQQVNAVSRQIMMNNINTGELRGLHIPLPPLSVQKQIMDRVDKGRKGITHKREESERLAREIHTELEALIVGTKKVSEI